MKAIRNGLITSLILILLMTTLGYGAVKPSDSSDFDDYLATLTLSQKRLVKVFESLNLLEDLSEEDTLIIAATGDIMFHKPQMTSAYDTTAHTYNFYPPFEQIAPYIRSADYALANFETTTSGSEYDFSGYPAFNAPDETLDAIKSAGFDYLSTANNHAFDRKLDGVYRTLEQMDVRGFDHGGTYMSTDSEKRYIIKEVKGFKLGILSLTYGLNGFEKAFDAETLYKNVNLITPDANPDFIETQLKMMESEGLDSSIVFIHWGNEYQLEPNEEQVALAHNMIEWGADIILGSHPHVIQKSEIVTYQGEDKYIIYSMGNFISNQNRKTLTSIKNAKYTEDGVMIFLTLARNEFKQPYLKSVKHIPTWVYRYPSGGKTQYQIVPTIEYLPPENPDYEIPKNITDASVQKQILESYHQSKTKLLDYPQTVIE